MKTKLYDDAYSYFHTLLGILTFLSLLYNLIHLTVITIVIYFFYQVKTSKTSDEIVLDLIEYLHGLFFSYAYFILEKILTDLLIYI